MLLNILIAFVDIVRTVLFAALTVLSALIALLIVAGMAAWKGKR